jgi:protein-L-isoaspartate O-methyltransferase
MPPTDRQRLRAAFNQAAELYDRARPGYPPALFDDLAERAGIGPGCRVLEIGPGTGQATLPLAERGCQVVAVELGAELAAVPAATSPASPRCRSSPPGSRTGRYPPSRSTSSW